MAVVAVVLFVVLAVMPVAADNPWPTFHATYLPVQDIRSDINLSGNNTYYFTMPNGTGGMNALHISGDTSNFFGGVYTSEPTTGTLYASDTGGRGGQDDVILLIGINSTNATDLRNFAIQLNTLGYQWGQPLTGYPPAFTSEPAYDTAYYNYSGISQTFTAANYLQNASSDVFQSWKFAPLTNFPMYYGQNMSTPQDFKFILVDTNLGTIGSNFAQHSQLQNNGMEEIDYDITSNPSSSAVIAMNVYDYSNVTGGGGTAVNWLNPTTNASGINSAPSSWLIQP